MASNPPFQVEDQTDEDFFDKLIDDDLEPSTAAPKFAESRGSDDDAKAFSNLSNGSDEAKSFANLSIDDTAGEGSKDVKSETTAAQTSSVLPGSHAEESVGFDNGNGMNNHGVGLGSEVVSDSVVNKDAGSGVKEVGWSSFYADMGQNGSGDFESDFFNGMGDNSGNIDENIVDATKNVLGNIDFKADGLANSIDFAQYTEGQTYSGQSNDEDPNSSQYWESLYPGWKYDPNTGQWYQVDGYDSTGNVQGGYDSATSASQWVASSDGKSEVSYLQRTAQSVSGTISQSSMTESVSNWQQATEANSEWRHVSQAKGSRNQDPQLNNGYPDHMVFDPQYPGWYYDMLAQEWRSLESYTSSVQSSVNDQQNKNGSTGTLLQSSIELNASGGQMNSYGSQTIGGQGQDNGWSSSYDDNSQHGMNMWQLGAVDKSEPIPTFSGGQQINTYSLKSTFNNHVNLQNSYNSIGAVQSYEKNTQSNVEADGVVGFQSFVPGGNFNQPFNRSNGEQDRGLPNEYYGSQNQVKTNQQPYPSAQEFPVVSTMGRSSAGRPPHALVTFGFGGKLIVMRDNSSLSNSSFGSQDAVGGSVSVLNLAEVVMGSTPVSSVGQGGSNYFHALCQQSFPGPLVGGNVGTKELNRWIDERIANCESMDLDDRKGKVLKLLLSLLKIACQHYGKLRSPFGTDTTLRENDTPETAVAKLFGSAKNVVQFQYYSAPSPCVQNCPSEYQIQATASEVQNLLVSGRKKEALQCAQEGQLWGPALVLATQLGDQFYVDTVKQMALCQLVAGSPLRTLCLLIAGQPAEVFSTDARGNISGAPNFSRQHAQYGANGMLDDWEENLAVIAANRTKDDELVIVHLGDSLWKERSDITAAHICYLVAEANFESYSDIARLCLVGADHWKYPRTYASPEAIQRTELYEYSKVLGNSQFILLPFQPYKLIYAYMLAELGRLSDSLKYCQAVMRSLKTGRAPEVETWKQLVSSLEERIKTHQQGGYTANLAPAKLVGKLLNFFDSTAHKVVGGMPPPPASTSHGSVSSNDPYSQPSGSRVSTSQSTMAMSSLMPSSSMEPISEWSADGNRKTMYNRSVSEPDFSRNPKQVDSSKSNAQDKGPSSGGASRLSRFGFGSQILQKTVGLVLRPRPGRQAKLGEKNKFYYDEKLKRWVEEGADPPAEEAALPPPPTTAAFQNGTPDYNSTMLISQAATANSTPEFKSPSPIEHASGIPPIAPSSNQFSARGRMGVRSRYVDTFNKGGGTSANLFQAPSLASMKPAVAANQKFFVPTPAAPAEQTDGTESTVESMQENSATSGAPTSASIEAIQNHTFSPSTNMQRFPSMDNIARKGSFTNVNGPNSLQARRTASWSGSFVGDSGSPKAPEAKSLGEALGLPLSAYMPTDQALETSTNSGRYGDDLHDVEL